MRALLASSPIGLALRLLLVAACVLPFAAPRKLATALWMPAPPVALGGQVPAAPVNEEDESEREEDAKARESLARGDRRADLSRHRSSRGGPCVSPKQHLIDLSHFTCLRPTAADPFRNGLGTPFRC